MAGRHTKTGITGKTWNVYTYTYGDGMRAIVTFDVDLAQEASHTGLEHAFRVILFIPLGYVLVNGLPLSEALPVLRQFETGMLERLDDAGVACRLVGTLTYGGMREFVFQAEDADAFLAGLGDLDAPMKNYRVEVQQLEGWTFFDEKVRPSAAYWQQIFDRTMIEQLMREGSDPLAVHRLEHSFSGDNNALTRLSHDLQQLGLREVSSGEQILVLGSQTHLTLEDVFALTNRLLEYSDQSGVHYEGWNASVIRKRGKQKTEKEEQQQQE